MQIREWIAAEGLQPGDRIQSQNELATHFGVTAVTVHKALTELAEDGVLYRRIGSGTFVGPAPGTAGVRSVCLVLPGEHLEEPGHNPLFWPYVQSLYRRFLSSIGSRRVFSTRPVSPGTPPAEVAPGLALHDVVFFHHTQVPRDLLLHLVRERVVPVVAFGLPRPDLDCLTLDHDMGAGMRLAVAHLHACGHRRIALLASREAWADPWRLGYRQGLAECALAYDPALDTRLEETRTAVAAAVRTAVAGGLPLDAICCDRDLRALWVIDALRAEGVRVPEDVSVMGYDGLDLATQHPPYLTSIDVPFERMIRAALDIVDGRRGQPTLGQHLCFAGELIPGQTVYRRQAALAGRSPSPRRPRPGELLSVEPKTRSQGGTT